MRPSLPLLVRVLARSELQAEATSNVITRPLPGPLPTQKIKKPTLIQQLLAEKAKLGDSYPLNIRIEPILERKVLQNVNPEIRKEILGLMREK